MMRLVLIITTICIWIPFAYSFFTTKKCPDMGSEIVLAWGLVVGGKAAQAYIEKRYVPTDTPKA